MKRERHDAKDAQLHAEPKHTRLDAGTLSYFEEIAQNLKSSELDAQQKELLANNALEEAAGIAVDVATDAVTSRVIESLLPTVSLNSLRSFLKSCIDGENLGNLCSR